MKQFIEWLFDCFPQGKLAEHYPYDDGTNLDPELPVRMHFEFLPVKTLDPRRMVNAMEKVAEQMRELSASIRSTNIAWYNARLRLRKPRHLPKWVNGRRRR